MKVRSSKESALFIYIAQILAMICFDRATRRLCEIFDGQSTRKAFGTKFPHNGGGLGLYNGQPTAISGYYGFESVTSCPGFVETRTEDGWIFLTSHPR